MIDPDITHWEQAAKEYNELITKGDILRKGLLDEALLGLIGDPAGLKILDAGCGEGYLSNILGNLKAQVIGIDGSQELIKIALNKYKEKEYLKFLAINLKNDLPFENEAFDIIICNMVLMDFDPIAKTMREFSRILKTNGYLIFSILHPAFSSGKLHKSFLERILYKIPHYEISKYHTEFKKSWKIVGLKNETAYYHRPIESYVKQLKNSNFLIEELREPTFNKEFVKDKNNYIKFCSEIPPFLIIKAVKLVRLV